LEEGRGLWLLPALLEHLGGEMNEVPKWQRVTALVVLIVSVAALVIFRDRLTADFWPPDRSFIGPNIVASIVQWSVVVMVAALLWPPTRRRIQGFVTGHLKPLHDNHAELLAEHAEMKRMLHHIIKHHPEIPDLPPE
jgi:hypothetical protein